MHPWAQVHVLQEGWREGGRKRLKKGGRKETGGEGMGGHDMGWEGREGRKGRRGRKGGKEQGRRGMLERRKGEKNRKKVEEGKRGELWKT